MAAVTLSIFVEIACKLFQRSEPN